MLQDGLSGAPRNCMFVPLPPDPALPLHDHHLDESTQIYAWRRGARLTIDSGVTLGAFGAVTGVFALFFFADIPRVRKDIMQAC